MAITSADLDSLKAALASGILTVEYQGKRTTFKSNAELQQAITYAEQQLGVTQPTMSSVAAFRRD